MNKIEFVSVARITNRVIEPDSFTFNPKGRLAPLFRLMWNVLRKHGGVANAFTHKTTVTRHVVNPDGFINKVYAMRADLFRNWDMEGKTLLIGAEDYASLMREQVYDSPFDFMAEVMIKRDQRHPEILGLKVRVIPWMRGLVVI